MTTDVAASVPSHRVAVGFVWVMLVGFAALIVGLISIMVFALEGWPVWAAPAVPIALVGGAVFLWNTFLGLCCVAFAIGPLGVLQKEIASVTLNLPEIMILALALKEIILFIARGKRLSPLVAKWSLAGFIAACLFGIYTGIVRGNSLKSNFQDFRQYTEYLVVYLLVLHCVESRREVKWILFSFMCGMTLLGLHGILQRFTGIGIAGNQLLNDAVFYGSTRSGSFYGATPLGGMMVLAVGIAAGLVLSSRSRIAKIIGVLCACLCLVAAVFTNTRASWIAIAVCLFWIFMTIRKTTMMIVVTVLIGLIFSVAVGDIIIKRMESIEISHKEKSLLERVRYYTAAWHIFRAYPLFGLGWGCEFNVKAINQNGHYVPPPSRGRVAAKPLWVESTVHSAYLQVLVRIGAVGLAALLSFLTVWFVRMMRARRLKLFDEAGYNLLTCVTAAILGYLVHSMVENFFQWPVMAQSLWLLLGLTTLMAAEAERIARAAAETAEA